MAVKSTIDLINEAAAKPDLSPREAVMNLGRLALHLGVHDKASLKVIGPALGNIAQGIGKVAAAEAAQADGGDGDLLKALAYLEETQADKKKGARAKRGT